MFGVSGVARVEAQVPPHHGTEVDGLGEVLDPLLVLGGELVQKADVQLLPMGVHCHS